MSGSTSNGVLNITQHEILVPNDWEISLAAATIFLFSSIGFCAYMPVLYVFVKHPRDFFDKPYYRLILSLCISDLIMLTILIFYTPISIYIRGYPLGIDFDRFLGVLCNLSYFSGLTCVINISINRYIAVCHFRFHCTFYDNFHTNVLFFVNWLVGFVSCIPQMLPCCYLRMWPESFSWGYNTQLWGYAYYAWYDIAFNTLIFSAVIICYTLILRTVRLKKLECNFSNDVQNSIRTKQELSLAVQFLLIGLCQIFLGLSFILIPTFSVYHWHLYITTFLYILNLSLNPFIYLFFNGAIYRRVVAGISAQIRPATGGGQNSP